MRLYSIITLILMLFGVAVVCRPVEGALATEKALYEEMKKVVCGWVAATKKRLPPKTQLSVLYAFQEVAHMYDHPKGQSYHPHSSSDAGFIFFLRFYFTSLKIL